MKISNSSLAPVLGSLLVVYCTSSAHSVLAGPGSHGVHVHGIAELTLVMEGPSLEINFTSPAMDVLGFEHASTTSAQKAAVEDAKTKLRDAGSLFLFTGADCTLLSVVVDMPNEQERVSRHHSVEIEQHSHDKNVPHSDISAHYEFQCSDGQALESLQVGNVGLPFGLQKINAMWVMEAVQGAAPLTANQQRINFK